MYGLYIAMLQNPGLGYVWFVYFAMLQNLGLWYVWFVHCHVTEPRARVFEVCTLVVQGVM